MKNFWNKFKIFWKEVGNVLTNLLCPLLSILCAFAELIHLPNAVINVLKKAEYWCFYACGTKEVIDELVSAADSKLEDDKLEASEAIELIEDTAEVVEDIVQDVKKHK